MVTIGALAGTATKDTDYTATALASITIPANASSGSGSLTLTPTDDQVVEGDETIVIPGTTTTQVGLTVSSATVTLTDDDKSTTPPGDTDGAELSISGPASNVTEGSNAEFTVTLSAAVDAEVQVAWTAPLSTDAATATDLGTTSGTVTFAANSAAGATQTITVAATDDQLSEGAETFTVTLGTITSTLSSQIALTNGASAATATIAESDPITVTLSGPTTVDEGDATSSYTVALTPTGVLPTADLTVSYGTANGTARAGTDYTAKTGTLTFTSMAAGAQTFTVQTTEDTLDEGTGETFTVAISSPAGGGGPTPSLSGTATRITTTITDDDAAPTGIALSASPNTLGEDDSATSITVTATLRGASTRTEATVVTIGALAGTATKDTDYTATALASITIPANASSGSGSITLTPTDDQVVEGDETIIVTGTTTVGLNVSDAIVTLTDDGADITLSASPSTLAEDDSATSITVTATLQDGTRTEATVVTIGTLAGTATKDTDYTAGTLTSITIPANTASGSGSITLNPTDDAVAEGDETIVIPGTTTVGLSVREATVTLTDDDADITLSASPANLREDDRATTVTVTALLSGSTRTEATVVTIGTLGGTATQNTDYTATTLASITIPADAANGSGTITLTPADDKVEEGDETIEIPGSATGLTVSPASVTLADAITSRKVDAAKLSIAGPSASVAEGSASAFTVTLSKSVAADVTVAWTAPLGTDAAAGADLGATSGTVTFPANSAAGATQTISITATDDERSEPDESFTVTLGTITSTLATQVALESGSESATATISASDPITVELSGPATVDEGDAATYTVSLTPDGVTPTADLTLSYGTADGTATAGTDYTSTSGTLTFTQAAAGSQTFTVQTTDDILSESGETFTVTISSPSGGGGATPSLGTAVVTTTIEASDPVSEPPEENPDLLGNISIQLSVSPDSVDEGDGETNFTVKATLTGTPRTQDISIALSLGGTADSSDYTAPSSASVTIPANESSGSGTLTLTLIDDSVVEGDETITVGGSFTGLEVGSANITVNDNDATYLSISGPSDAVDEGSNATFTVTLSQSVGAEVSVAWEATAGTAESSDYTATSGTVTFPANSAAGATRTITIPVADDDLSETTETFSVSLGANSGSQADNVFVKTTAASAQATIAASDPITLTLSGPETVSEGDLATYTVSLTPDGVTPTADLTVSYGTADGTATAGTDYAAASGTLTFTATAAGSQTFTVQTTQDALDEGTGETFTVSISGPSGGGGPTPSLGTSSVTTTLADGDAPPTPTPLPPRPAPPPPAPPPSAPAPQPTAFTLDVSPNRIAENAGPTTVTLTTTLKDGTTSSDDIIVTLTLSGTADASDYTVSRLASITIPAGQSSKSGTLTITPKDDGIVEDPESIDFVGSAAGLGQAVDSIALVDASSNVQPTASLSIETPLTETLEGSSTQFTVTLSRQIAADVTVAFHVTPGTANTSDYTEPSQGTLTFPANSAAGARQVITIATTQDMLSEAAETLTVTLGTVSGDLANRVQVNPDRGSATATIAASDPITVNISGPSSVDEGDATADYTVWLSPFGVKPTSDLIVSYGTADGTAAAGTDYTATSGTLTFTQAALSMQTFTVSTVDDTLDEGFGETFTVSLSSPAGGGGPTPGLGVSSVSTTIADDDASPAPPSGTTPTPPPGTTPAPPSGTTPTPPPGTTPAPPSGTTPAPPPGTTPTPPPETTPTPVPSGPLPTPASRTTATAAPTATPTPVSGKSSTPTPESVAAPAQVPTTPPPITPVPTSDGQQAVVQSNEAGSPTQPTTQEAIVIQPSWLTPWASFLLVTGLLVAVVIAAARRRRNRAEDRGARPYASGE